jgi:hypothetical protein
MYTTVISRADLMVWHNIPCDDKKKRTDDVRVYGAEKCLDTSESKEEGSGDYCVQSSFVIFSCAFRLILLTN